MEGSLHRFRLGKVEVEPQPKTAVKRKRGAEQSACERCRGLKRKCVRKETGCVICGNAGIKCSFDSGVAIDEVSVSEEAEIEIETTNTRDREMAPEMTSWLAVCLNESLPQDDAAGAWTRLSREDGVDEDTPGQIAALDMSVSRSIPISVDKSSPEELRGSNFGTSPISTRSHRSATQGTTGLPAKNAAGRQLADAYFRHIHRSYPFINRSKVLKDVDSMINLTDGFDKMSRKLYLIMAIGCTTLRRIGQVSDDICAKFKIQDQVIIQDCLSRKDIESVEELLLLALYSFFDPTLSPWIITGILTRQILTLGLTRKVSNLQTTPLFEIERRHRLFWSIYTLDRIVSASTGLPFGLSDVNTNVPLPGIALEEYASTDRAYFTITLQVNRHIISLRQLEGSILERVHFINSLSLVSSDRRAIIADLRHKIEDWYTQGCLVNPLERDQIPFHNTIPWLNCRYQNLLLLLYMPSSLNPDISTENLQILQIAAAKYIQLSAVLFQQRHLPLNWVTLCRFVALCPILLYCLVRGCTAELDSKEAALSCAEVLEAFSESWDDAKRAAAVFRRVAGLPVFVPSNFIPSDNVAVFSGIVEEVGDLIGDTLGCSSIYCGLVDAAKELLSESGRGIVMGGWNETTMASNGGLWMNNSALWDDGDMSMHII